MTPQGNAAATPRKPNRGRGAGPENRRALIDAAREIFATEGLRAPLSSIAKRAGVGQGSLYRHFPDRLALAVAVFDENLEVVEQIAKKAETSLDDFFALIAEQAVVSTALIDLMWRSQHDERVAHVGESLARAARTVLDRDIGRGRVGRHVELDDVLLAVTMLADAITRTDGADARLAVASRVRAILHAAFAPRA
ncbi:TetR family transcriptional regulator [Microbacterium immunditiarum]|uniref:AcrR family transcriptional regulator n=1 Tax=Microbacterium immunditiarum TaxID=337480 RepID=A0A7Y9GQI8_9MICO|nr:AcrR family transcriptional regulator [Microbacterium immunditiarum]